MLCHFSIILLRREYVFVSDISAKTLSQYRLTKAKECYLAAKNLLEDDLFTDSANRSYYAIFHTVRSLLALDGVDFKKHSGVISYFQRQYIKTGIFDTELSDIIKDAFSIRQNCDYEDFFLVSKEDVLNQLENAKKFIDIIQAYLQTKW
ncbi:MAG: HEPN domain-containing protein [Oscillospiraceae bacterium]|nr:HEPN domain-containing protein [Oscillospiraceae bacterium]MCI9364320.1 HEPN domain-containing protein [Oscillospiraceae bacterium]MCI9669630.1 HEPN domain-containing protein [Oscillospiraceae bacterium]